MKKLLLITFIGITLLACSKDELELNNQQIEEINLQLDNCSNLAGPDNSINLTTAQIEANYNSVSRLKVLYTKLLGTGTSGDGTWSPSIQEIALNYVNSTEKYGAYTSTYMVSDGNCTDFADITVNVVSECNVNAGKDNTSTVLTLSQIEENYNSISKLKILFNNLIGDDVSTTGTFNPTIEEIAMLYNNAQDKTGYYSTTYTVGTGNCIDTAELGVTVVQDEVTDPICTIDAGPDNSISLTTAQIESRYNSISRMKTLFNKLLGDGVNSQGIWSPTIDEIAIMYVNSSDKTGTYTSTFTLIDGSCQDAADISIIVTQ